MNAHILIRPKTSGQPLLEFADEIYGWLHMSFEQRTSNANQTESIFYRGAAAGIVVEVSENPKRNYVVGRCFESYAFLIGMAPEATKQAGDYLAEHAHILAWRLSQKGYACFVPKDWTAANEEQGLAYNVHV